MCIGILYSDEIEIAKDYIKKAYLHIDQNKEFAHYFLEKSYEYYDSLPEYYYLKNYSLQNNKIHLHEKYNNAKKVLATIKNAFLIDKYLLLKDAADIFEKNRDFTSAGEVYAILLSYNDRYLLPDYLSYIRLLFNAGRYEKLEGIISSGEKKYFSLDFVYYRALLLIKTGTMNDARFKTLTESLQANYYDPVKILHLTALYVSDNWRRIEALRSYREIKENKNIPLELHKKIIYALLLKSDIYHKDDIHFLLDMWIKTGGLKDIRTSDIVVYAPVKSLIEKDKLLQNSFLYYTGVRYKDDDDDGLWEALFIYSKGTLGEVTFDANQDGIYEKKYVYFDSSTILEVVLYSDNLNFKKYLFNTTDRSLMYVENWQSGVLTRKTALIKSACYFPDQTRINQELISRTTDYTEDYTPEAYIYTKYNNGQIEYRNFDGNRDNFFEYRKLYRNGSVYEALKDTNFDKTYDTVELYKNGKLTQIKTKTDITYNNYDYKEKILDDGVIKYWDRDHDGLFEIALLELNNGVVEKKIDINYDFSYDFILRTTNSPEGKKTTLYAMINGEKVEIQTSEVIFRGSQKNWTVATTGNPAMVILPDSVKSDYPLTAEYNGKHKGYFIYQGKKFFFSKSTLIHNQFHYKLFVYDTTIFLFDQTREE